MAQTFDRIRKRITNIGADAEQQRKSIYMGGTEVLTQIYSGQKMYLDTRDYSETPHLLIDGYWEVNITRVFEQLVQPGDVVMDIGSTYGYYGLVAGSLGAGFVICVDPNPVYEEYLKKNLTVNGMIATSAIEPIAVGDKKGTTKLHVLKDDWNSTTTQELKEFEAQRTVPYEVAESVDVAVETVDAIISRNKQKSVNVIKMDIEGLEEAAYDGMQDTIANSSELKLLMEFSPQNYSDPKAFFERLQNDFTHLYVMPEGARIARVSSYHELLKQTGEEWMMILASKVDVGPHLATLDSSIADASVTAA